MRILAALALIVAVPLAVAVAPVPASAVQAPDAARGAAELAKLIHPVELAVATAAEGADRYLVASMVKQKELADLEKKYPGVVAAMYQSGRPFMLEVERRNAERVQKELTALYRAELTAAEIDMARGFFSGETGRKIIRGMFDPAGVKDIAEVVARDPEAPLEVGTLVNIQEQTAERLAASATAQDEKVAAEFMNSSAGVKLQKLVPRVQALVGQIVNQPHPDLQSQIDSAMKAAALRFVEAAGK